MKAIILARVSTKRQEQEGLSLEDIQLPRMREYAEKNSIEVVKEFVFQESADRKRRTSFDDVVTYFKQHKDIQAIICFRVDRITRNYRDAVIIDDLRIENGKEIHFVDDRLVLTPKSRGRDIQDWDFKVFFAKQHINRLKDDASNVRQSKAEKGELSGPAPFGYENTTKDGNPKLKWVAPKEPEATIVKKMFEWYSTGVYSMDGVRKKVQEHFNRYLHKGKIDEILKRKFYYGIIVHDGKEYPHYYERLITEEIYDRVQKIKAGFNKKHTKYSTDKHLYQGLIKCGVCGCSITPEIQKGHTYYHCTGYKGKHKSRWIREEELTKHFVDLYKSLQMPKEVAEDLSNKLKEMNRDKTEYNGLLLTEYTSQIKKYQSRISNMYDDKLDGSITENDYTEKKKKFTEEIKILERKIEQISKADEEYYLLADTILSLSQRAGELFESSELEQKREILNLTLQNFTLTGEKLSYDLIKPFDIILKSNDNHIWLRDQDSNLEPNGYTLIKKLDYIFFIDIKYP